MEAIVLKAGVRLRVQFLRGPNYSTYHECDNDAEEAEAEGGHEESHVLILLLRKQKITWHCALRMRGLKVSAMRVSVEFRAILIICVEQFSTFVLFFFFLQSKIW